MGRFSRPPNDPLFLAQTQAYWLQWHYEEIVRQRETLGRQIEELAAQVPNGHEERSVQQTTQDGLLSRYNKLGEMFDLPKVDLAKQLQDDLQAARDGRLPEWMRQEGAKYG